MASTISNKNIDMNTPSHKDFVIRFLKEVAKENG
jgi:hypothetical protein